MAVGTMGGGGLVAGGDSRRAYSAGGGVARYLVRPLRSPRPKTHPDQAHDRHRTHKHEDRWSRLDDAKRNHELLEPIVVLKIIGPVLFRREREEVFVNPFLAEAEHLRSVGLNPNTHPMPMR